MDDSEPAAAAVEPVVEPASAVTAWYGITLVGVTNCTAVDGHIIVSFNVIPSDDLLVNPVDGIPLSKLIEQKFSTVVKLPTAGFSTTGAVIGVEKKQLSWYAGGQRYLEGIGILQFDPAKGAIIAPEYQPDLIAHLVDPTEGASLT